MTATELVVILPLHDRYDEVSIAFYWASAALVLVLFGTALAWRFLPRGTSDRPLLERVHIPLGIMFAAVLAGRLIWRTVGGRRLPGPGRRLVNLASHVVQTALYVLFVVQTALGLMWRWLQGEGLSFLGLLNIPTLLLENASLAGTAETAHNYLGWALILLAAGHALAALWHHYAGDGVTRRML